MSIPNARLDHILPALNLQQCPMAFLIKSGVLVWPRGPTQSASLPITVQPHFLSKPCPFLLTLTLAIPFSLALCMAGSLSSKTLLKCLLFEVPSLSTLSIIASEGNSHYPAYLLHITLHNWNYLLCLHVYYLSAHPHPHKSNSIKTRDFSCLVFAVSPALQRAAAPYVVE